MANNDASTAIQDEFLTSKPDFVKRSRGGNHTVTGIAQSDRWFGGQDKGRAGDHTALLPDLCLAGTTPNNINLGFHG